MREHGEPTTPEPRKESTGIEATRPGRKHDAFRVSVKELEIARGYRIQKSAKGFIVPSQSGQGTYLVPQRGRADLSLS
jgi:hypothetical protein